MYACLEKNKNNKKERERDLIARLFFYNNKKRDNPINCEYMHMCIIILYFRLKMPIRLQLNKLKHN